MTRFAGVLFRSTTRVPQDRTRTLQGPAHTLPKLQAPCQGRTRAYVRTLTSFFTCRIEPQVAPWDAARRLARHLVPLCPRTSCAGPWHGARTTRALQQCGQRFRTHRSHMYCMHTCRPHMHSQAAAHDSYCPATANACVCVMETAVRTLGAQLLAAEIHGWQTQLGALRTARRDESRP